MADAPEERLRRHEAMMAGLARRLEAPHEFNRQPLESHADVKTTLVRIETLLARMLPQENTAGRPHEERSASV
jgi:hypothetical protein